MHVLDSNGIPSVARQIRVTAPSTASSAVGGTVSNGDGPVSGVGIDLFVANANGTRGAYVASTTTAANGTWRFNVVAGCYVATYIAPTGQTFTNGSQWLEQQSCPTAGQQITNLTATLNGGASQASVGGTVRNGDGPVSGVGIDLFVANANGTRGAYLSSTTTAANGTWQFSVAPGCYVVTYGAPSGQTFTNGSQWLEQQSCPTAGQQISNLTATLNGGASQASVGGTVRRAGAGVGGVGIDLFVANADGSCGVYLSSATSAANGSWRFNIAPGCYVVTYIAPLGQTFTNGSQWLEQGSCPTAGQNVSDLVATLN